MRWVVGSGVNSYWVGSYKIKKQEMIANLVKEGMVCYDIGAHVGFYILMFLRLAGEKGEVYAFEPFPPNIVFFLKHIQLNKINNVIIPPIALYKDDAILPFIKHKFSSMGYLKTEHEKKSNLLISAKSVDKLISQYNHLISRYVDIVKIDVEGLEMEVLEGMVSLLKDKSPVLLIALDDKNRRRDVYKFLLSDI